jgi:hypothetical protein
MKAVIVAYARTPFHFARKGALAGTDLYMPKGQTAENVAERTKGRCALATQCIGGGQRVATVLENLA